MSVYYLFIVDYLTQFEEHLTSRIGKCRSKESARQHLRQTAKILRLPMCRGLVKGLLKTDEASKGGINSLICRKRTHGTVSSYCLSVALFLEFLNGLPVLPRVIMNESCTRVQLVTRIEQWRNIASAIKVEGKRASMERHEKRSSKL